MVIQTEKMGEMGIRLAGGDNDWQVQKVVQRKSGPTWEGTNFFCNLQSACGWLYEKLLREDGERVDDLQKMKRACTRVKDELVDAVGKAVRDA